MIALIIKMVMAVALMSLVLLTVLMLVPRFVITGCFTKPVSRPAFDYWAWHRWCGGLRLVGHLLRDAEPVGAGAVVMVSPLACPSLHLTVGCRCGLSTLRSPAPCIRCRW